MKCQWGLDDKCMEDGLLPVAHGGKGGQNKQW